MPASKMTAKPLHRKVNYNKTNPFAQSVMGRGPFARDKSRSIPASGAWSRHLSNSLNVKSTILSVWNLVFLTSEFVRTTSPPRRTRVLTYSDNILSITFLSSGKISAVTRRFIKVRQPSSASKHCLKSGSERSTSPAVTRVTACQ